MSFDMELFREFDDRAKQMNLNGVSIEDALGSLMRYH